MLTPSPPTSERQRVEYLFNLYQRLTAALMAPAKGRKCAAKPAEE